MKTATPQFRSAKLSELPLWRLIIAMADAETMMGVDDPTTRLLAVELQRRTRIEGGLVERVKKTCSKK